MLLRWLIETGTCLLPHSSLDIAAQSLICNVASSDYWQEDDEEEQFENGWECGYNSYLNVLEADVRVQHARGLRPQQLQDADAASTDAAARYFQQGFQQG